MKKLATVLFLLLLPRSFAADPNVVIESAQPLVGALESLPLLDSVSVTPAYLPGYGLHLSGYGFQSEIQGSGDVLDSISTVVEGLSSTVQGLAADDWVSVSLHYNPIVEVNMVVRVKPTNPASLETWLQGQRIR